MGQAIEQIEPSRIAGCSWFKLCRYGTFVQHGAVISLDLCRRNVPLLEVALFEPESFEWQGFKGMIHEVVRREYLDGH